MNEVEKTAEQYFKELPENLQQAINEIAWKASIQKIAMANALDAEQSTSLEAETMLILYGIEEAVDYIGNITRELNLEESKAKTIAGDVTKEIFEPIMARTEKLAPEEQQPVVSIPTPITQTPSTPKVIHNSLPMIEKGEVVHDVPPMKTEVKPEVKVEAKVEERKVEFNKPEPAIVKAPEPAKPQATQPQTPPVTHYEKGKDPYREPLV